jgi:hypothetical protein
MLGKLREHNLSTYPHTGWVVMRTEMIRDIDEVYSLPNGVNEVKDFIEETWIHFNEDQFVDRMVSLEKSFNGEMIQYSIFEEGRIWNSVSNQYEDRGAMQATELDRGFIQQLLDTYKQWPEAVTMEMIEDDQIARFTVTTDLPFPSVVGHYSKEKLGVKFLKYIDFEISSGSLMEYENIVVFEDGSQRVNNNMTLTIDQNVTPSEEVMMLFSNSGRGQ